MLVRGPGLWKNGRHAAFPLHHATVRFLRALYALLLPLAAAERQERSDQSERGSGKENIPTLSTDALRPPYEPKQQKTALNMAKFIQNQSLLLLENLTKRSRCWGRPLRNSTMMREHLSRTLSSRLDELQDGKLDSQSSLFSGSSTACSELVVLLFTRWLTVVSWVTPLL